MDFDAMAYPDVFEINGQTYKGRRDRKKSEVLIPYTEEPSIGLGDVLKQISGGSEIFLRVFDTDYLTGGSLNVGTNHPHLLTLNVENLTAAEYKAKQNPSTINIGSISGQQVQVGNQNTQVTSINLTEVVDKVIASGDSEAKGILRQLLENNTVASIVGAGTSALITALCV